MSDTVSKALELRLHAVEIIRQVLNPATEQEVTDGQWNFQILLEHRITDQKAECIAVECTVKVSSAKDENLIGEVTGSCEFYIGGLKQFIDVKKGHLNFPEEALHLLNSITISTMRGLMFGVFRGTALHNAYLPIIDPKDFTSKKEQEG